METYCRACGRLIDSRAFVCPSCGVRQHPHGTARRTRLVAGLLALFLGGLGVHKFYLGRNVQGVFYLLFCWTFIPAFIALIDAIYYLLIGTAEFDDAYN